MLGQLSADRVSQEVIDQCEAATIERKKRSIKYLPKRYPQPRDIVAVPSPDGHGWVPVDRRTGQVLAGNRARVDRIVVQFREIQEVWQWVDQDYERQVLMAARTSGQYAPAQNHAQGSRCKMCFAPMVHDLDEGVSGGENTVVAVCESCQHTETTKALHFSNF